MIFGYLHWDPDRVFFVLPYINHPMTFYGLFFAFGFLVGYFLVRKIFRKFLEQKGQSSEKANISSMQFADRLSMFVLFGTVIGARLGHVFFYGWSYYFNHPEDILRVWEGGLSSHGGAVGILISLLIFIWWNRQSKPKITFLCLLDLLVIPTAFAGGCIRMGNFMNQEINGIPTNLPWGIVFVHPVDGIPGVALHPVQIYESITYFGIFVFLFLIWRYRPSHIGVGLLSGWFFLLTFGLRFLIEFLKMPQNEWFDRESALTMGQFLSIPFVILGIYLLVFYYLHAKMEPYLKTNHKIFIAGSYGMVGSAIKRLLLSQGYTQLLTPSSQELDCVNQMAVRLFIHRHQPDIVIIAAGKVGGIYANTTYPADFIYTNLMIASNLIHESYQANVERLLYLGSTCIYPREAAQPIQEMSLLTGSLEKTNEAYAIAKIAGIKLCQYYRQQYDCQYIAVMPTNLYGPGDNYHPENSHVIPGLIHRFQKAKEENLSEVSIWGQGKALREFLYVDDLAKGCLYLLKYYNHPDHINIGSNEEVTIGQLANMIAQVVNYEGQLVQDLSKPDGIPRKKCDISRITQMGWHPEVSLKEGLKLTYQDYLGRINSSCFNHPKF
ncbi:MAG: prolipoprotein diacylglyceryl transferase [Chlamydiales bacterium]